MKVLVTGATGFLGSHLAEQLVRDGHQVRATVRSSSNTRFLESLGVELANASLETGAGFDKALQGVDAVVHGAAIVKARRPDEFYQVNAGGTQSLLDAVRAHAPNLKRFVYVSSLEAHGFSEDGKPRAVHAEPKPVTHYGRSKLEGEQMVLAAKGDLPVTVIRPPAIYGPRDTEMFAFFQVVNRRLMPFMGDKSNTLSIVYAPDCARAIVLSLTEDHDSGSVYFVEDGEVYTQHQMGQLIADALGKKAIALSLPIPAVTAVAAVAEAYGKMRGQAVMLTTDKVKALRQRYIVCSSKEIRQDLGWSPAVPFAEGARVTADWYKNEGWL